MSLFNVNADLTPLIREARAFKMEQQISQAQIIALLQEIRSVLLTLQSKDEEQNQLLKQLLQK